MWSFLQRLEGIQQISGELFAGRTVLVGGNDELLFSVAADIQSFFQLCGAVAVEVRQHKDLAALGELGVRHLGGHGIHQTFLHLDVGVLGLADVMDSLEEIAISQLDDVDLGIRDTAKVLIILSISFLLVAAEDALTTAITFSALIAIMFIGIGLQKKRAVVAKRLSVKYGKLWVAAEVFLFVLVGATVNIGYLGKVGAKALLLIVGALVFRMLGVFVCLLGTSLSKKERLFAMMAYTPKATVQAAIGGIPLALGFACGDTVLTVAVLAIVLTAPLGAFAMDLSYKKLLKKG